MTKKRSFLVIFWHSKNTLFLGVFHGDPIWYYILMQYLGFGQYPKKGDQKGVQKRGVRFLVFFVFFGKSKNGVFERLDLGVPQKTPKKGCFLTPKNTSFSVPKYQVRIWVHICQNGKKGFDHFFVIFRCHFFQVFHVFGKNVILPNQVELIIPELAEPKKCTFFSKKGVIFLDHN